MSASATSLVGLQEQSGISRFSRSPVGNHQDAHQKGAPHQCWTVINTPDCVVAPLYEATRARSPLGAVAGTTTLSWNRPTYPLMPANATVAGMPPMVTAGRVASVPSWEVEPLTTAGETGPKPLA